MLADSSLSSSLTVNTYILADLEATDGYSANVIYSATIQELIVPSDIVSNAANLYASITESIITSSSFVARFLWEVIDDTQTTSWGTVSTSQIPNWQNITDTQNAVWTPISTTQSTNWVVSSTNQVPNWTNVNTY